MARVERPPGPIRTRLLRGRRAVGRTRAGRVLKRLLGRDVRIPVAADPDPEKLLAFPGEDARPPELRGRAILAAALGRPPQLPPRPRRPAAPPARTGRA